MIRFILHVVFTWVLTGSIATLETSLSASLWQCTHRYRENEKVCVREKESPGAITVSLKDEPPSTCQDMPRRTAQTEGETLSLSIPHKRDTNSSIETIAPFSYQHYFSIQLTCGVDGKVFGLCELCSSIFTFGPTLFLICVLYQFSPDQPKGFLFLAVQVHSSSRFISETAATYQNGIKNQKQWESSKMHYSELFPWGFL